MIHNITLEKSGKKVRILANDAFMNACGNYLKHDFGKQLKVSVSTDKCESSRSRERKTDNVVPIGELGISPYPWKVCEWNEIRDANGEHIVITDSGYYPPEDADAQLIALAPSLYNTLYDVYLSLVSIRDNAGSTQRVSLLVESEIARIENAMKSFSESRKSNERTK